MHWREEYLQFIWQYRLFNLTELKTLTDESINIFDAGQLNPHQGPDYLYGRVKIGDETFYGHIEIHLHADDWYRHGHHSDPNYSNVILHVVLQHYPSKPTKNIHGELIPTICLENYISEDTIQRLSSLMESKEIIPCKHIYRIPPSIQIEEFKSRILVERIANKSHRIQGLVFDQNQNYESACYQAILSGFGITVNSDVFLEIAQSLPLTILAKHLHRIDQLEALLLGQANLLSTIDEYSSYLTREYEYLKHLYHLIPIARTPLKSKILPPSFPTIRLVQFAAWIYRHPRIFAQLIRVLSVEKIKSYFDIEVSPYWHLHYDFGKQYSSPSTPILSQSFVEKLIINSVLPFRIWMEKENSSSVEHLIEIYMQLKPEKNKITKLFSELFHFKNQNAFDSQSYIEWYQNYCLSQKCLDCPIGFYTLRLPNFKQ